MITIAELNDLAANPQVAYDGYDDLRAAARARNGGLADPREIPLMQEVVRRRGADWCMSVIGKPFAGDLRTIPGLDAAMLLEADQRDLEPPAPAWLVQWTAESADVQRRRAEAFAAAGQKDRDRWAAALAASGVSAGQIEVRPNTRSAGQVRGGRRQALLHVVPLIAVRSPRRRHPAGRELCAVSHVRELGAPSDGPATCVSCVAYTAVIEPAVIESGRTPS